MIINSIRFYHTDFDSNNNNVIDFVGDKEISDIIISNYLISKYPNDGLSAEQTLNKGISLDNNKNFVITLKYTDYIGINETVKGINYIIIDRS